MSPIKKHPEGLVVLFFTEMWERFSFYGMRALLTLYLTLELFSNLQDPLKKATAFGIYAAYGALVYATPFIGGLLADKFLGHKRSVMWGAVLMAIGHFIMAVPTELFLYIALAFLILGNGFFKPNISSIVGSLYEENDSRRDGGFTIFYMGINLGAFLAPLICGFIGEKYGWHYGFGIAGVGMLTGLFTFYKGGKSLKEKGNTPQAGKKALFNIKLFTPVNTIYALSFVVVALLALLVKNYELMSYILTPFAMGVIAILIIYALRSGKVEREKMFVILILLFFTTLFWAFFEQAGSSLTLFAKENVNRNLFSSEVPASLFQAVNPLFILIFAPLFSIMWIKMGDKKKEPSTPMKFFWGVLLLGLGFLLLAAAPYFTKVIPVDLSTNTTKIVVMAATVPMIFLFLSYLLQTWGELCLSPIGLSMVTKLASLKVVAMVMGAWFLSSAMAHHLGGIIANFTSESDNVSATELMITETEQIYANYTEFATGEKKHIRNAIASAYEILQNDANEIALNGNSVTDFNIDAATQTAFAYLSDSVSCSVNMPDLKNKIGTVIETGALQIINNSRLAVDAALETGYYTEDELSEYSLSSLNSLNNLLTYTSVFRAIGIIACIASAVLLLLVPLLRRMMHGVS